MPAYDVDIWTDGSTAGYAAILIGHGKAKLVYGPLSNATNSRCEMMAIIRGIELVKRPSNITIHSDSQFIVKGWNEWRHGWARKGWRKADGRHVANLPLWKRMIAAAEDHQVTMVHVRGHQGDELNETADIYAGFGNTIDSERVECPLVGAMI